VRRKDFWPLKRKAGLGFHGGTAYEEVLQNIFAIPRGERLLANLTM